MEAMTETKLFNPPAAAAAAAGMEMKRVRTGSSAAVSSVLSDDDLLREILLRLGFPTCLVRAAAVCKRWLRHASDPTFLRRFRDLHPPRLLGFYLNYSSFLRLEFVPILPQPPELAAVQRRGSLGFALDTVEAESSSVLVNCMDCRNGRVFVGLCCDGSYTYGVHSPLHPARGVVTVPSAPCHLLPRKDVVISHVLSRHVGDGLSYFWFSLQCNKKGKATAYFYKLQDDAWRLHTSAETKIPGWPQSKQKMNSFLTVDDKIYLVVTVNYILVFDPTSSSFVTIDFPDGLAFDGAKILLSQANDSGLYLIHLRGLKLSIWLYRGVDGSVGNWLLLDTISLRDMCADLRTSDCKTKDGHTIIVNLNAVGDNAEFVFLEMDTSVFYLDVRSRALHKAYELTEMDDVGGYIHIRPFMMIWPPTFPALKE